MLRYVLILLLCSNSLTGSGVNAQSSGLGPNRVCEIGSKDTAVQRNYRVRVLLQEAPTRDTLCWKIKSTHGFVVVNPDLKTKTRIDQKELTICPKKDFFLLNNGIYDAKRFYIYSNNGHLKFEDKEYQGSFLVVQDTSQSYLINSIDIEEYVCSVLRTESWPGWPLEVNKAFAIASRSYVIGVILSNRNSDLPYHVKNTNKHQTYSGVHTEVVLKDAVEQTKGIFLTHNGKPIIAMFDSCCGGVIPAHIHGVNFIHSPYLERKYPCTYCKDCKMYNWSSNFSLAQWEQILNKEFKHLKKIKHITVAKKDKAGLVQQVSIKGHTKLFSVSGKRIYSLFSKKVRSFCFDITCHENKVILNGRGIGHHLGLCQWGAREMVRQGFNHKSILSFYYPDTQFMRLS